MGALAVPIAMGISSWVGSKAGKSGGGSNLPFEQQSALTDALSTARQSREQGGSLFGIGAPLLQAASGYWRKLLEGNKNALIEATAPERNAIEESALGADRSIEAGPLRGGSRDYARAELNRTKFGMLGMLVPGARRAAAEAGGNLGMSVAGAGAQTTANAGSMFSTLYGNQERARQFDVGRSDQLGKNLGSFFANLLPSLVRGSAGESGGSGGSSRVPSIGGGGGFGNIAGTSLPAASWAGIRF